MSGRNENKIKANEAFQEILKGKPDFVRGYYNFLVASSKEYKTCIKYTQLLNTFLESNSLDKIEDITFDQVVEYMEKFSTSSDSYRALIWASLNKFFKYAQNRKLINENPCDLIEKPKIKDHVERVYLEEEEIDQVIKYVKAGGSTVGRGRRKGWLERDLAIIVLFVVTGMRLSALSELDTDDYDETSGIIKVVDKGRKTYLYPLEGAAKEYLDEWLKVRSQKVNNNNEKAIFISNRRTRMTIRSIQYLVDKYTEVIDKHITPHKFRATFGINLYNKTKDIHFVQSAMGHSKIATTEIYLKGLQYDKAEPIKLMNQVIK